ncbi:break repair meiotic recombinase recruitment factor 1 [Pteropus medius]|uniref:break repair meiotic recombinase recruitment factor 1 n=1 Tax=Pteropus vampyrus TaxID=132908 RepID=UPI00196B654F|nr:break repair meiotic recombinase recruitment factor 1 [Pteropus giganteus]XP_039738685.1 break repair meiotic recombinase recruitment factor 1 [Pteropus giganteus]XP_039738686.1 break repair meiotic recombinase recruitment factor 1 [Pteropus giganteus]XP_039738687.1 break repair meiotic recombinase recruitment factor 1 [Pteropus giganteus]
MSKRKKLRTSGGEGIHPLKPPKHPRLRDSDRASQSYELDPSCHPEESEGRAGPAPSAEQSGEEPGQVASSSPNKEAGGPSRLLRQPENEPVPFPPSQNSVGRFVPQFAKLRKTVTRQAATKEEDFGSGAFSSEILPEPSAQHAGSQSPEESPGLTVWEADGAHSKHGVQNPVTPVSGRGHSQPEVSNDASPEWGTVPLASERASQDHLLEQGTNLLDGGSTEWGGVPGDRGQKGHQPSSEAEEKKPDQGSSQEEGAQGGAGANQEEGDSIPGLISGGPEPGSVVQGLSDFMQTLSKAGREAQGSCSSPRFSSLRTIVTTDVSTDPTQPEQRALEVAGLGGKAPDGGHSWALPRGMPLCKETAGGRGETRQEAKPPGNVPGGPAAFLALAHGIQEPIVDVGDSIPIASEMGSGVDQTWVPGSDQEGLGGFCALPLLLQPLGEKATKLGSQSYEQDLRELSLSLGASAPLVHREAVDGPPLDTRIHQGNPDALNGLAGQPKHPPDSADQAVLGESPAMELDFLPDSQIQDALEASDFEDPPEQFPAGRGLGPCWPGTSLHAVGDPLTKAHPSTHEGIQPCEAARMEDATDTMRGLIVELSNLNRMIMNAHRDMEASKRLSYRKAKPASGPYTPKGAGPHPRGEQSWRDT